MHEHPTYLVEVGLMLGLAVVTSVYGTHMVGSLRREAFEARRLGQYRLLRLIGSGGMGDVYLAEHQLMKRPCAIKVIRPSKADDPQALARFEREVHATAQLSHWNSVEIFDYGRAEDGTFYYVMEYLPGLSLAQLVERYGPLPPARVVYLLAQVCDALAEAHAAGLIHRDIKPGNIFAAVRGGQYDVAKLLDFGLAKPMAADDGRGATDPSRHDHRLAAVHVARASDRRRRARRPQRHLFAGGRGLLSADRPAAVRRRSAAEGDRRPRLAGGGAAVAIAARHSGRSGSDRAALPGQGAGAIAFRTSASLAAALGRMLGRRPMGPRAGGRLVAERADPPRRRPEPASQADGGSAANGRPRPDGCDRRRSSAVGACPHRGMVGQRARITHSRPGR